jgi:uncharacterized protein (TIGR03437 family)
MPLPKTIALCLALCSPTFSAVLGWYNGSPQLGVAQDIRNQYVVNFPESCAAQYCLFGVYDDFIVPAGGWTVVGAFSHNYMSFSGVTQAYWEIRSGVSLGNPGTLVASGISPATQTWIAPSGDPAYAEYEIQVNGLSVGLAAGKYWLLVAPVGAGYSYINTTSGAGALGNPAGNDGQAFYTGAGSNFIDTTTVTSQSGNSHDFSLGILIPDPPVPVTSAPAINDGGIVIHDGVATAISPGSLVDLYGTNLTAVKGVSAPAGATLPTTLGGVQVRVNGTSAPLVYVDSGQIVFQLPYETALGAAGVSVVTNGTASAAAPVTVQQAAPNILTWGSNWAVVLNLDGTINAPGNGAKPGDEVVVYLIGSGPLDNAIPTGAAAPLSPLSREKLATNVVVGGSPATVKFAGMTPNFVGLVQVNFVMPSLAPGEYPIQVAIGGSSSNQPVLTVTK